MKMHFLEKKDFQVQIIKTLYESYQLGNNLCDVVIHVKDVTIKAHKAVLASFSLYFADLFLTQELNVCDMGPDVDARCLVLLLNYMYTGLLSIDGVSQSTMYETSVKLNIPSAQELLLKVLGSVDILPNGTNMIPKFTGKNSNTQNKGSGRRKKKNNTTPTVQPELFHFQFGCEQFQLKHESEDFTEVADNFPVGNVEDSNVSLVQSQRKRKINRKTFKSKSSRKKCLERITDQILNKRHSETISSKKSVCKLLKVKLSLKNKGLSTKKLTKIVKGKKEHFGNKKLNNIKSKSQCSICAQTLKLYNFMHRHMVSKHASIACVLKQNIYQRWICGKFYARSFLQKRKQELSKDETIFEQEPYLPVSLALESASVTQTDKNVTKLNGCNENSSSPISDKSDKYTCICGKNFLLYSNFTLHARKNHMVKKPKSLFALVKKCLSNVGEMYKVRDIERIGKIKKRKRNFKIKKNLPVYPLEFPAHCQFCFVEQTSADSLVQHLVSDHRYRLCDAQKEVGIEINFTCKKCEKCFESEVSLTAHIAALHAEIKLCPHCGENFSSIVAWKKHLRTEHSLSAQEVKYLAGEVIVCEEKDCNFLSCSYVSLRKHVMECHPGTEYRCPECGYLFHMKSQRDKHLRLKHSPKVFHNKKYVCSLCDKRFTKSHGLVNHNYTVHGIESPNLRIFKCDIPGCDYQSLLSQGFKQHVRTWHMMRKPSPCPYCNKELKTDIILQKHIKKMHLNIRPHMCHVCGFAFGENAELQTHINNVHSDERQFQCEYCAYSTSNKCTFKTHLFSVHGVKAEDDKRQVYKCEPCNFVTIRKQNFRVHMNRHKDIREYKCKVCKKMFMSSSNLRVHFQFKHSNKFFPCPDCDYKAKTKKLLNDHIRMQHLFRGVKPYKCPYCEFQSASGGNCRKHIMQRHKGLEVYYVKDEKILAAVKSTNPGASISAIRIENEVGDKIPTPGNSFDPAKM